MKKHFNYSLKGQARLLKGCIINICSEGFGMQTCHPVEDGNVLNFADGIGHEMGMVKWSRKILENHYRVGVEFI